MKNTIYTLMHTVQQKNMKKIAGPPYSNTNF